MQFGDIGFRHEKRPLPGDCIAAVLEMHLVPARTTGSIHQCLHDKLIRLLHLFEHAMPVGRVGKSIAQVAGAVLQHDARGRVTVEQLIVFAVQAYHQRRMPQCLDAAQRIVVTTDVLTGTFNQHRITPIGEFNAAIFQKAMTWLAVRIDCPAFGVPRTVAQPFANVVQVFNDAGSGVDRHVTRCELLTAGGTPQLQRGFIGPDHSCLVKVEYPNRRRQVLAHLYYRVFV